jgi:hypothetical protein
MVKVSIEVRSGAARFDVAVRAESVRRAMELVGRRFPNRDIRAKFPQALEGFYAEQKLAA